MLIVEAPFSGATRVRVADFAVVNVMPPLANPLFAVTIRLALVILWASAAPLTVTPAASSSAKTISCPSPAVIADTSAAVNSTVVSPVIPLTSPVVAAVLHDQGTGLLGVGDLGTSNLAGIPLP